jgi:hypothetical protein
MDLLCAGVFAARSPGTERETKDPPMTPQTCMGMFASQPLGAMD